MPFIAPAIAAVAAFIAATPFLGTALLIGGGLALSAGAALLMRTGTPTGQQSYLGSANSPEVRGSIKQDIPPHRVWLGLMRGGGAIYFYRKEPPYLYIGYLHSVMPLTAVHSVLIAEQELTFRALPAGEILAPLPIDDLPPYHNRLEFCWQRGDLDAETNPLIARDFPGLDRRLPGIANSVFRFHYGSDFEQFEELWGRVQIPDAQIIATGCPIPDPRQPTHRLDFDPHDPDDLYDAISTWRAQGSSTSNASLIQAFWAAMPFGLNAGPAAVYGGASVETLKRSADFDDESVPILTESGPQQYQRRHTIDGIVTLEEKPLSTIEAMLRPTAGLYRRGRGRSMCSHRSRSIPWPR